MRVVPIYINQKAFLFAAKNSIDRKTITKGQKAYCVHYRTSHSVYGCFVLTIDDLFKFVGNCDFPSRKEKEMFLWSLSIKNPLEAEADIFYDFRYGHGIYRYGSYELDD